MVAISHNIIVSVFFVAFCFVALSSASPINGNADTFVKRGWRAGQQMTRRGDYHVGLFDPKRSGSRGFHEGIFDEGFGGFSTLKRKRRPEMTSRGIHGDAFTVSNNKRGKRGMDMDTNGFYGDTFDSGFGGFETVKRSAADDQLVNSAFSERATPLHRRIPYVVHRKRMDMGLNGFHGDTFSSGFGDFSTARRKRIMSNSNGFYGDTFSDGFGDFSTAKRKRTTGMNAFHGDTFSQGFGDFMTV